MESVALEVLDAVDHDLGHVGEGRGLPVDAGGPGGGGRLLVVDEAVEAGGEGHGVEGGGLGLADARAAEVEVVERVAGAARVDRGGYLLAEKMG